MPRIYVIGALVYDIVFDVPDWVEPNRAVHATEVTVSPGGKALNQAVAACLLGADDVRLVGCVGDDPFGAELLQAAARFGVNTDCVRRHPTARTSLAGIVVKDNLPGFIGAPDASRHVDRRQVEEALVDLCPGDILLVNFEVSQPVVRFALELGRGKGAVNVLNPAPFFTRDNFVFEYMCLVDVLIPNRLEAQLILDTDGEDIDTLAAGLRSLGIKQVVLTLGEAGSVLYEDGRRISQKAYLLDAVDTTAASDAFVGAYCHGLAQGWSPKRRLEFASATAGLACTKRGTMSSLPSLSQVQALLRAEAC
ncbi:MAG: ribokinase [Chloroflexi bacterium]|nr:ribokinase [Chloroflexota bacterium]